MRWNQRFNHYKHVKLNGISLTTPLVQIIFVVVLITFFEVAHLRSYFQNVEFNNLFASIFGYNNYDTRYFRSEEN
jgi:hypothetical protein